jgi:hypothetical protein
MIKILKILLVSFCVFSLHDTIAQDIPCDVKAFRAKGRILLRPYRTDGSTLTKISYKKAETIKEFDFPLFVGEKYRFIFFTDLLPKDVEIQIYNKDKESKNRKLLYSSKDEGIEKREYIFEIAKSTNVYVDYVIPSSETEMDANACLFMMYGHK